MEKKLENEYSVDKESIWIRTYFYRDKLKAIYDSNLDNETLGIIFRAVMYHIINYGEEPEINDFTVKVAYNIFVADIDRDKAAYIQKCKQNHENRLKGERTNVNDGKRTLTNVNDGQRTIADKDKDKDKDKDTDKDKDKEKKEKKSLSLLEESDRGKNKNLFFELSEGEQKEYLKEWLTENFRYNSDKVDEEVQKRLFYILGNEKDKTKTIDDIKNNVCSYWANKRGLEYKEPEKEPEEPEEDSEEEDSSWFDSLEDEDNDEESKEKVCLAFDSIKKRIESMYENTRREIGDVEIIGLREYVNDDDVRTVNNLREYLTAAQLNYLQKHGIID
jgi:hypothetical protein